MKNAGVRIRPVSILRSVSLETPAAPATATMLRPPRPDGSRAAHAEHTVAVTADGPRVLTEP